MLTKEERAAIIDRLRYVDYIYDGTLYRALFGCDAPNDASFEEDSKAMLERLADLIDPICKPVEAGNNIVCSKCGADLYDDDLYCPHCGARVVRDEA